MWIIFKKTKLWPLIVYNRSKQNPIKDAFQMRFKYLLCTYSADRCAIIKICKLQQKVIQTLANIVEHTLKARTLTRRCFAVSNLSNISQRLVFVA